MVVGGSTTSLLSILDNFDYSKYEVSLLLLDTNGDLQHLINPNVRILQVSKTPIFKRLFSIKAFAHYIFAEFSSRTNNNRLLKAQINSKWFALSMPRLKEEFDVAISFLEFWPQRYVAYRVRAKRKISWIHIDPKEAGLKAKYSKDSLELSDTIVLVSNSCQENFNYLFPELSSRSCVIENILDAKIIQKLSEERCDLVTNRHKINLVSVCRINFASKALDRLVKCMIKLKDEGLNIEDGIDWYIIGDGPDEINLRNMVSDSGLTNIHLLGKQLNPYKYESLMDCFVLPSKYEGKPMAVTEAQMLGVVPIVCHYSSAPEQISNRVDGIIVPNEDYSMCAPLRDILSGHINLSDMQAELIKKDFSNTYIINDIYKLINL